jgi:hypothetical protein
MLLPTVTATAVQGTVGVLLIESLADVPEGAFQLLPVLSAEVLDSTRIEERISEPMLVWNDQEQTSAPYVPKPESLSHMMVGKP